MVALESTALDEALVPNVRMARVHASPTDRWFELADSSATHYGRAAIANTLSHGGQLPLKSKKSSK